MQDDYNKRRRTYQAYNKWLISALNDSLDAMIIGSDFDKRLGLFNQMFLLMQMCNENYASARPTADEIRCMSNKVYCQGLDTFEMERIWPPSYDDGIDTGGGPTGPGDGNGGTGPGDGDKPPTGQDGIDYMSVAYQGTEHPTFRIRK